MPVALLCRLSISIIAINSPFYVDTCTAISTYIEFYSGETILHSAATIIEEGMQQGSFVVKIF